MRTFKTLNSLVSLASLASLLALTTIGCGGDGSNLNADATVGGPDTGIDAPPNNNADASIPAGFELLIARDWTIPAGSEIYRCTRLTITEDMYVSGFSGLSPTGTHHTVLSLRQNSGLADGDYNCDAGAIAHSMLFASGVGSDTLTLPQGVAIPLRAGDQLDLNLHLYNVSDAPISGTSGTLGQLIPAAEVQQEAEVVFGGTYAIVLSANAGIEQTMNGGCRFSADATVVALWPHMHQLGRHIRIDHQGGAGNTNLLDTAFSFQEQVHYPIAPVSVNAGERLDIQCTYVNDTGRLVTFGDSSEQEMCFVGIYRYPATNANVFECVGT